MTKGANLNARVPGFNKGSWFLSQGQSQEPKIIRWIENTRKEKVAVTSTSESFLINSKVLSLVRNDMKWYCDFDNVQLTGHQQKHFE